MIRTTTVILFVFVTLTATVASAQTAPTPQPTHYNSYDVWAPGVCPEEVTVNVAPGEGYEVNVPPGCPQPRVNINIVEPDASPAGNGVEFAFGGRFSTGSMDLLLGHLSLTLPLEESGRWNLGLRTSGGWRTDAGDREGDELAYGLTGFLLHQEDEAGWLRWGPMLDLQVEEGTRENDDYRNVGTYIGLAATAFVDYRKSFAVGLETGMGPGWSSDDDRAGLVWTAGLSLSINPIRLLSRTDE